MNKKLVFGFFAVIILIGIVSITKNLFKNIDKSQDSISHATVKSQEKVYVALEEDGKVAVINTQTTKVQTKIELSKDGTHYMPHNVQVAPDGKSVWVTANAEGLHDSHDSSVSTNDMYMEPMDEVIIIDPQTDTITKRIPLEKQVHLAHVVLAPDSKTAYVTGQMSNAIYKINTATYAVDNKITTSKDSQPHGLRINLEGSKAFIALMGSKTLGILDLKTDALAEQTLDGAPVQTGVTADGKYAFSSLFDRRKLALYEIDTQNLSYIALPDETKGALQVYATPDSRFVYVADQGYYLDQPISDKVYKIDLVNKSVVKTITVGKAPHGIVVSEDGKYVYTTNLVSGDISIIDTATHTEVERIPVGKQPNGITIWSDDLSKNR